MRAWKRIDGGLAAIWLALTVTCFAGWQFKAHCLRGGWTGGEQYSTGCYTDVVPFWKARGVNRGLVPYFQAPMEYPVLTGAQIWTEGAATRLLYGHKARGGYFLGVVTFVNALVAGLILHMALSAGLDRRRAWLWALAPPLVLYLGHNWDIAAAALAVGSLLAARRGKLIPAAALAALGAATKLFPALMLPLLGLAALAEQDRPWRERLIRAAALSAAAIGAWALVNLPVALAAPENWSEFYRFSQARAGTVASFWSIAANRQWFFLWNEERNVYATAAFLAGAALIVALGGRRHRARMWLLFPPVLAWFMLANKVYSPQFDLWLMPLLVLAAPRLAPVALFVVGDLLAYFAEFWWLGGLEHAQPAATLDDVALAAGVRAAAMLWLIADAVWREPPAWLSGDASARRS
jgi:uncharacterized membrane protein